MKNTKYYWVSFGSGIILLIIGGLFPGNAIAQFGTFDAEEPGFGLWLSFENQNIDPATDSTTNEDTGYLDVLPSSLFSLGIGIGFSVNDFGIDLGYYAVQTNIDKDAEIQQNNDSSDDLTVKSVYRTSQTWSVQHHLFFPFYYGIGEEKGQFEFEVITPSDSNQVKVRNFYNSFLLFGMVMGSEISTYPNSVSLLSNLYVKIPTDPRSYTGNTIGIALTGAIH